MRRADCLALVLIAVVASCDRGSGELGGPWVGKVDTTSAGVDIVTLRGSVWSSPHVVYSSGIELLDGNPPLTRPHSMHVLGATLLIADADRVQMLDLTSSTVRMLGRNGAGPGEYRRVTGIGVTPEDTVLVWDGALLRMSWFTRDGRFIKVSYVGNPHPRFNDPRQMPLGAIAGGAILGWSQGIITPGGPPDSLLIVWTNLSGDSTVLLAGIGNGQTIHAGSVIVPRNLFQGAALVAVSNTGVVALSDGTEYCIRVLPVPRQSNTVQRYCRQYRRVAVTPAIRHPPIAGLIQLNQRQASILEARLQVQEYGAYRNSHDELRFDDQGQLWVRIVDDRQRAFDRMLMGQFAELRPPTYIWELFDSQGRFMGQVHLSSRFNPLAFASGCVYGAFELPSGEMVAGVAPLPNALPDGPVRKCPGSSGVRAAVQ